MFKGVGTALITPFKATGEIDFPALDKLIDFQLDNGIDALIVLGTTGEPATMTSEEREAVMKFAITKVNGRIPVIIGTGCNNTKVMVEYSIIAEQLGADGLLVVTPYYNKCTQAGLIEHYKAVNSAVQIPIIAYNVPSRTGVNLLPSTYATISKLNNIIAIKEASGDIEQISEMSRLKSEGTYVYSGDDAIILPVLSVGGNGIISVSSNIVPKLVKSITDSFFAGDLETARAMQHKLSPLVKMIFSEVNPIPVKMGASILGYCTPTMRLPLTTMTEANAEKLSVILKSLV